MTRRGGGGRGGTRNSDKTIKQLITAVHKRPVDTAPLSGVASKCHGQRGPADRTEIAGCRQSVPGIISLQELASRSRKKERRRNCELAELLAVRICTGRDRERGKGERSPPSRISKYLECRVNVPVKYTASSFSDSTSLHLNCWSRF